VGGCENALVAVILQNRAPAKVYGSVQVSHTIEYWIILTPHEDVNKYFLNKIRWLVYLFIN